MQTLSPASLRLAGIFSITTGLLALVVLAATMTMDVTGPSSRLLAYTLTAITSIDLLVFAYVLIMLATLTSQLLEDEARVNSILVLLAANIVLVILNVAFLAVPGLQDPVSILSFFVVKGTGLVYLWFGWTQTRLMPRLGWLIGFFAWANIMIGVGYLFYLPLGVIVSAPAFVALGIVFFRKSRVEAAGLT